MFNAQVLQDLQELETNVSDLKAIKHTIMLAVKRMRHLA